MNREQWTKKLARIIADIEAGRTPAAVREVYVFGSYARGAVECKDLDLVVVHEEPPVDLMDELRKKAKAAARTILESLAGHERRFNGLMGKALRRPGEDIDILMGRDLGSILQGMSIRASDLRLVWSVADRAWQEKLQGIPIDARAGAAPRDQFISPKHARTDVQAVEHVTALLREGSLKLTRIATETVDLRKSRRWTEDWADTLWLDQWGKKSLALLPYACAWLEGKKVKELDIKERGEIWDAEQRFRVQLGRLHLYWMVNLFEAEHKLKEQCLIPHARRGYGKELLIFERGPNWESRTDSARMPGDKEGQAINVR
jgi:predicted nucleotidyltransferase